jgi:hypothetical protein
MTFRKDDLIELLRLRYDPYSAEAVFELARQKAELPQHTELDHGQLAALRAALAVVGDRVQVPLARIDDLLASAPGAPRSKSDARTEAKPEAKSKARSETNADADTRPESKPDARSETHADADTKPESKPHAKSETNADVDTKAETNADDAAKPDASDAVDTTIVLTGVPVGDGDELIMCGGLAALGDWDPARGRPMARSGEAWQVTLALAPDADVAFKFVRRTADGKLIWEPGDDRHLVAKPRIEVRWRSSAS